MAFDPVCGMEVNPKSASAKSQHAGVTFYFCAQECRQKFDDNPRQYLDESDLAEARAQQESEER
jgi:Cu+-exporting ATPase